jgi:regulator of sirC expression with transglutaminase-like and TPR domain
VIPCPACKKASVEGPLCQHCGAELRLPALLDRLGRLCFNRALELLKEGDLPAAENQLSAACALMPLRAEGYRALGKLRAQLGRLPDAAYDLSLACRLAPEDADAQAALAEVRRLARRERLVLLGAPVLLAVVAIAGAALLWAFG